MSGRISTIKTPDLDLFLPTVLIDDQACATVAKGYVKKISSSLTN